LSPALADHTAASRGSGEEAAPLASEQTYAELDREVDRLASGLECGLRPGERIGAVLANGPELLQLWFAVARAGVVVVPGAARSLAHPPRARRAAAPRRDLAPGRPAPTLSKVSSHVASALRKLGAHSRDALAGPEAGTSDGATVTRPGGG
jgi:acyl-CoA synthetase (AMP-forming)/AMP-acid ligase II